ncbi:unnamed protein product [Trypanosoma congolense IL3000]|uniref:WGS project CAEQ00000000 data, annotated contig 694 n=1 Tax=Trypanosoma congolense (strain IL3000) TaxID=1068625 RepID=F9WHT7_TRYCI|nr:unnamed protein product [Trypanosoma congolense IL3000]
MSLWRQRLSKKMGIMKTRKVHINLLRIVPLPVVGCPFGAINLEDVKLHSFHFSFSRASNKCIGSDSALLRLSPNSSRCSKTTSRHLFALSLLPCDFSPNPDHHYHFKKLTPTRRLIKIYFWGVCVASNEFLLPRVFPKKGTPSTANHFINWKKHTL